MSTFTSACLAVDHAGENFLLHPGKVLYWPSQNILFAADVHVGKEHVFGRQGIAIPAGISESTLNELFSLAHQSGASRLIVLGDFMHNIPLASESWLIRLSQLLNEHEHISVEVVAGNHDRKAGRLLTDKRLTWHNASVNIGALALHHEPCKDPHGFVLCGHLHPAWRLGNARRGAIRAPVFWFQKHCAVLPAFGEFTGGVVVDPDPETDTLYMTGPDCVVKVPSIARTAKPHRR